MPYEDQYTFLILSLSVSFSFENHAVYKIMWENTVEPGRSRMTVWRMRIGRWIPKATNTLSEYVIIVALLQQWLHARLSVALCVHCPSFSIIGLIK